MALNTLIPHSIKLVDCTNSILKVHLKVPKGRGYNLVLGMPGSEMAEKFPYKFSGRIQIIEDKSSIIDFPIGSELIQSCNWLNGESGFILTGFRNTNCPALSQFIHPQKDYDIEIDFDQSPPPSTSIWLFWLQAYKDKEN
jgi:hypothetical protein